jgi:tape measure domain-containing protein
MGKLDFSIAINLLTDNFKKGANQIKSSFQQIKSQVLSFAAVFGVGGFAITNLVAKVLAASRETAKANMILKNVSSGALDFSNNLKFASSIAQKYGLYINDVTSNFAKFTASARTSNISMSDQKKIFESVTRAGASFGLSGEQTTTVLESIEKSMRKGTLSARDFRGALGTQIPVAMQAMSMAMGVSLGKLNDMAKKGQLLSKDVWPKFAAALTKLTPSINTDTIAANLARLKNAFTAASNSPTFLNAYNNAIKDVTKTVQYAANNIKAIITTLVAYIVGAGLGKMFNWIAQQLAIAQRNAMYAARRAAREAGTQFDAVKWKAESGAVTIGAAFKRAGAAIKSAFMSALPTAILIIISEIVGRLIQLRAEAEEIKNIQKEYKQGLYSATHTQEIEQLKQIQQQYNAAKGNLQLQIKYRGQINSLLGTHLSGEKEINKAISDRIGLLEKTAKAEYYTQSKISAEDEMNQIVAKYGGSKNYNALAKFTRSGAYNTPHSNANNMWGALTRLGDVVKIGNQSYDINDLINDRNRYNSLAWKRGDAVKNVNKIGYIPSQSLTYDSTPTAPGKTKESELQKIEDNYAASKRELTERAKIEKISTDEYNKQLDELNKTTYLNIVSSGDAAAMNSAFAATLKKAAYNPKFSQAQEDYEKAQKDYDDGLEKLGIQLAEGYITQQVYDDSVKELQQKTVEQLSVIPQLTASEKAFAKQLQKEATPDINEVVNKSPSRETNNDSTFDYKKTKAETDEAQLDIDKRDAEYYQQQIDKAKELKGISLNYLGELNNKLTEAQKNVTNMSQAVKIEQIKSDIEEMNKSLTGLGSGLGSVGMSGVYAKIETVKDGFMDLQGTISGLHQTFSQSGNYWNKFMTALESSFSIFNTIISTLQRFEEIRKTIESLTGATSALSAVESTASASKIASMTAESAAAETLMAAESVAAYADLPFIGEGLAAAQITSMKGMIAAAVLPAFANGGIVGGGSTSGDNVLARLNSGEMILNTGQQSNLLQMINNGTVGGGKEITSTITTRIKGSDMILQINNRLREKGKSLIGQ